MSTKPLWIPSDYAHFPNGRYLAYTEFGDTAGYPLIFCHGMPGCRLEGRYFHDQARAWGFRIITPDRAGIGISPPVAQRRLLDDAADIEALADCLELKRFGVFGWSSGGPVALATAQRLPQRLDFVAAISGYTNFAEYPQGRHMLLQTGWPLPQVAQWSRKLFRLIVWGLVTMTRLSPGTYFQQVEKRSSPYDRRLLREVDHEYQFLRDQVEVMRSGARAMADDLATQNGDWGFRLREIQAPVEIFQGMADRFVPVALAQHLASSIPQAKLHLLPDYGHLFPLDEGFQDHFFHLAHDLIVQRGGRQPHRRPMPVF